MNIAVVHNRYGAHSGEETVVEGILDLLAARGHRTACFMRSSAEIPAQVLGKARAFFSGIYNPVARSAFRRFLSEARPDLVHIHNLFPLISPSVLLECRRAKIPVVMTVHNHRLVCPTGLHLSKRDPRTCERCCGGREYWCVLRNCEGSLCKSLGYALRNAVARRAGWYRENVALYACLAEFQRRRLIREGYPEDRITVVPNMVQAGLPAGEGPLGEYVGFAGRVSPEKGVDTLVSAARICPEIPFRIAGRVDRMSEVVDRAPDNCTFLGHLGPEDLSGFYAGSRMLVVPSVWYEAFGLCAVEAQAHGKPVVCSRMGALPEIVVHGETGLLFEAGNAVELAGRIRSLWRQPRRCREMGRAGRDRVLREYGAGPYYERLMAAYEKAIALGPPGPRHRALDPAPRPHCGQVRGVDPSCEDPCWTGRAEGVRVNKEGVCSR
ncbi:MAG: glycosyltransferase [Phycisphaerae bacterium]|nr:glycosyltransferase [Phycisphaerae bacterium]